ncbi:MAG: hypothetical protein ACRC2B_18735, partial [Rubrivivax sp.]
MAIDQHWGVSTIVSRGCAMHRAAVPVVPGTLPDSRCGHQSLKLLAQHGSAAFIDRVHLEHVLCQIDANRRNSWWMLLARFKWLHTPPLWHFDAGYGWGVHP